MLRQLRTEMRYTGIESGIPVLELAIGCLLVCNLAHGTLMVCLVLGGMPHATIPYQSLQALLVSEIVDAGEKKGVVWGLRIGANGQTNQSCDQNKQDDKF